METQKWAVVIEIPSGISREELEGEITETLAAGFDLHADQYSVKVEKAA